jgi:hypothetical protein
MGVFAIDPPLSGPGGSLLSTSRTVACLANIEVMLLDNGTAPNALEECSLAQWHDIQPAIFQQTCPV